MTIRKGISNLQGRISLEHDGFRGKHKFLFQYNYSNQSKLINFFTLKLFSARINNCNFSKIEIYSNKILNALNKEIYQRAILTDSADHFNIFEIYELFSPDDSAKIKKFIEKKYGYDHFAARKFLIKSFIICIKNIDQFHSFLEKATNFFGNRAITVKNDNN